MFSIVAGFTACKKSDSTPASASVMFVNAATGTSSVSVSANGTVAASNIGFTNNSPYAHVAAGTNVNIIFSVNGSGISTPLVSGTKTLATNTHYSVFAGGLFTDPSLVVVTDDLTAPSAGMAKIRFVNLTSDNINASCFVADTKLDSNITYTHYSPFIEVSPIVDKITMLDPANPTNSVQLVSQTLNAGKIYTIILTGSATGTGASALSLTMINNN